MNRYEELKAQLHAAPRRWLVTGAAGFIGSNLVEALLILNQEVVGFDNFATGHQHNLDDVARSVGAERWQRFTFIEGDLRDAAACEAACKGADYVLHQGALGSVPRSIQDPRSSNDANVTGTLNLLTAAVQCKVRSVVYASSSSVYGDEPTLPKIESRIGNPLSPYAATKRADELYGEVFARCYALPIVGLRYFNVFGPRQDPQGAYAAVIPRWIDTLLAGERCIIFGDGKTSRDFCYIDNVIQANLLAAAAECSSPRHVVYNVAVGEQLTLRELQQTLCVNLTEEGLPPRCPEPEFADFRAGDIQHSLADISLARSELGYDPQIKAKMGLRKTVQWFVSRNPTAGIAPSG